MKIKTAYRYVTGSKKAGRPLQAYFMVTDDCNLKCKTCNFWKGIYKKKDENILSTGEVKDVIDSISKLKIPSLVITGGEPFLRKDIIDIIEYAVKKIEYVRIQTNGTLITTDIARELVRIGIDEVWISLDGMEEVHNRIRDDSNTFKDTLGGIIKIFSEKRLKKTISPNILINMVISKDNFNQIDNVLDLAVKMKVREVIFNYISDIDYELVADTEAILGRKDIYSSQFTTRGSMLLKEHLLSKESRDSIKRKCRKNGIITYIDPLLISGDSVRKLDRCVLLWANLTITPYGDIIPCQILDQFFLGNVRNNSLEDIWNCDDFKKIRQKAGRGLPVCQKCCVARRTILDHIKAPVNFKRVFLGRKLRIVLVKLRDVLRKLYKRGYK